MPIHRVHKNTAAGEIAALEQSGQIVVSVAPDGDGLWVVTREKQERKPGLEKRGR